MFHRLLTTPTRSSLGTWLKLKLYTRMVSSWHISPFFFPSKCGTPMRQNTASTNLAHRPRNATCFAGLQECQQRRHPVRSFWWRHYPHTRVFRRLFSKSTTKHSQIGFIIEMADKDDNYNLANWQSSRAPRLPWSTKQSELMALDIAFRTLTNNKFPLLLMWTAKRCGLT